MKDDGQALFQPGRLHQDAARDRHPLGGRSEAPSRLSIMNLFSFRLCSRICGIKEFDFLHCYYFDDRNKHTSLITAPQLRCATGDGSARLALGSRALSMLSLV